LSVVEAEAAEWQQRSDEDRLEDLELDLLLTAVARRFGYDFRGYAPASLRRRVRHAMLREGVATLSALQDRVLHESEAFERFLSTMSVHVTGMFRDPELFRVLRATVVPVLRTYPFVRIWHAGCSTGEEVYSLAITLYEEGILDRCRIYATDFSRRLLDRAQEAQVPLAQMREYTQNYHRAGGRGDFSLYYQADSRQATLHSELKSKVVFSQHNLVADGPFNEFHLVLCRNVLIYFGSELRERVHLLLSSSLIRFGFLALGARESLQFTPHAERFEVVSEPARLYRMVR
jgi:chemotaxis protein methyltransferase CheR